MQSWFNIIKPMNIIQSLNRLKEQIYTYNLNRYKTFYKIYNKKFKCYQWGIMWNFASLIKIITEKYSKYHC